MYEKIRVWIFVIALGVVLPAMLLKMPPKKISQDEMQATQKSYQTILVQQPDGSLCSMELEDYTLCVVLGEMPAEFESEALKAQAVLARTYALKRMAAADKHPQGAVCTQSSCCQAYCSESDYLAAGHDIRDFQKIKEAVDGTAGQVLTYQGELIEATYFSCSGGRTEDAAAVWGEDIPYLQATDSPGEENSKHYTTTAQFTRSQVLEELNLFGTDVLIQNISYTDGGGVDSISINGKEFSGVQLRQLLDLKSTAFQISVVGDHVIITTKGFGHRVGLSQYGADAMALAGSTYSEILAHYYPGTILSEISP